MCLSWESQNNLTHSTSIKKEKALLVVANSGNILPHFVEYQVEELRKLARTAGADISDVCTQNLKSINSATYIGKGKIEEIKQMIYEKEFDIILFNHDLSPVQQRNLERSFKIRTIDRTELILDIFSQHAQTKDGQIQVELAQLRYLRPRLTGRGIELSRLGGGIGTRGPGETKLEVDRRKIDNRISRLRKDWLKIRKSRRLQRKSRQRQNIDTTVLIGYTNAGKSTLLNRLTTAKVLARDQLFSTVDTTTRRLVLPDGATLLVSDTVGFISDLPAPLLAAFRATLEVVEEATLLLHVVDASSPIMEEQIHAVNEILASLECSQKPVLTIFNKLDQIEDDLELKDMERCLEPSVRCSALHDIDLIEVKDKIAMLLKQTKETIQNAPVEEDIFFQRFD